MMRLKVRDFGEVYCYADQVRGPEAVLNYEFARSRAATVRRYVTGGQAEGVTFSAALMKRLEAGEAALKQATRATDIPARVRLANDSLAETMWAGEMAVLERAQNRIRRNGSRPGFLFGANVFGFAGSEQYRQRFTAVFNFGTVPFYRNTTEPTEGALNYSREDAILEKTAGTPLLVKGHPLLWFKRQNMPAFLLKKSWPEVKASSREYALRHGGAIPLPHPRLGRHQRGARLGERVSLRAAADGGDHRDDVESRARGGPHGVPRGQQLLPVGRVCGHQDDEQHAAGPAVTHSARVSEGAHEMRRWTTTPSVSRSTVPGATCWRSSGISERFAALGKPLHITELGIPSANDRRTLAHL